MGGPIIHHKYVMQMDIFHRSNPSIIEKCQDKVFKQFLAYTFFENSDLMKNGIILTGLQTQQSLKNIQYPLTLTEANNNLSIHLHVSISNINKG
jgi:hypothetical protein